MPAKPHSKRSAAAPSQAPAAPSVRLLELIGLAAAHMAPERVAECRKRLMSGDSPLPDDEVTPATLLVFSVDLAIFTAPPGRSTTVDRLERHLRPARGSADAQLLDAMTRSRFALFALEAPAGANRVTVRDRFDGSRFVIQDADLAASFSVGARFAGRLVAVEDAWFLVGPPIPLDDALDDALEEAVRPWRSADGRRWTNPTRAAEALYRHALRHGLPPHPGENLFAGDGGFPFTAEDGPVHALALAWADRPAGQAPDAPALAQARQLASGGDALIGALQGALAARAMARPALADAYEHLLSVMLDTLQRRAAIGQRGAAVVLDWVEQELAQGIAAGFIPPEARTLFQRLKPRGAATAGDRDTTDLDRLRGRIQALRAKTVEQGCTEAEALTAAAKVAELLDRYGLSLSELELRRQICEGVGIDTRRSRRAPIDDVLPAVAGFCDCRCWHESTPEGMIRHVFFGLPADVEGAHYLYDLVAAALERETALFKAGALYREHPSAQRASAIRSFQVGQVYGIMTKLDAMKREREAAANRSGGRDLVPVKDSVIDAEIDKLGLGFTVRNRRGRKVLKQAYQAGQDAGAEFDIHPGVHGPGGRTRRGRG